MFQTLTRRMPGKTSPKHVINLSVFCFCRIAENRKFMGVQTFGYDQFFQ